MKSALASLLVFLLAAPASAYRAPAVERNRTRGIELASTNLHPREPREARELCRGILLLELQLAAGGTNFGFTGREHDAFGKRYHRDRYVDPTTGAWLQPDRLGMRGDGPNYFAFAGSTPTMLVDASGQMSWTAWTVSTLEALMIVSDFFMGFGGGRIYDPDSTYTSVLQGSAGYKAAFLRYKQALQLALITNPGADPRPENFVVQVPGCGELSPNPFVWMLGTYSVDFIPSKTIRTQVVVVAWNITSLTSLAHGHGWFDGPNELPNYEALEWIPTPMANVRELFYWTEFID